METVIEANFDIRWGAPVFIRIGNGFCERIDGPKAALVALIHRWPSQSQPEYADAKCRCADAIINHRSAEFARTAFIEAAIAVKVLS
ncbi:DUF982 domain-containing protein [Rhizobium sp. 25PS6]|uniref:DUF982 domain-containing protein n=1 Tax=Rhizobium aouanii TaxID=3118145 RepID=A0ABU8CTL6_9HYPH|nr:DUF982 domain-containing protein [Rhizobium sp. 25PS6]MDU0364328.1 DUF982 domain-containing protein [Rhizobium sp. 25PS6]